MKLPTSKMQRSKSRKGFSNSLRVVGMQCVALILAHFSTTKAKPAFFFIEIMLVS
jgi:hypothetical protein